MCIRDRYSSCSIRHFFVVEIQAVVRYSNHPGGHRTHSRETFGRSELLYELLTLLIWGVEGLKGGREVCVGVIEGSIRVIDENFGDMLKRKGLHFFPLRHSGAIEHSGRGSLFAAWES
eukprot:1203803-Amorphochlora_amoeboformis.AAC.2